MRFDIVNNINSITEEDISKLTALFDCSGNRASILKYFMDESILNKLSTEYINTLYKITKELVETRIEHIIETEYSETKLPKGTMVKIKPKYLEPKEDWYTYNVKFEGIPNVVVLYRKEFNIIETI